jgi:hypothetical protein
MNDIVYYEKEQIIVSDGGAFKLNIVQTSDRNSGLAISYSIHLGANDRKCFNMRFSSPTSNGTEGYLSWVEAHDECTFERYIEKGIAQHMISLGLTIARTMNPKLKIIKFEDISNITCDLPNGTEHKIPLKPFHIAFHQSTWYEYYFDAKLEKDYDKYVKLKDNFNSPSHKPDWFDFRNEELQEELEPLYTKTRTWGEFFHEISKQYGRKKCAMVYPWLNSALYIIFENNPYFESIKWYINLEENKAKNKTSPVYFEAYEVKKIQGGGRKTRRQRKQLSYRTYLHPNVPDVMAWKYKKFLK